MVSTGSVVAITSKEGIPVPRPSKYGGGNNNNNNNNTSFPFNPKTSAFHANELFHRTTKVLASLDELHQVRTRHAVLADRPILTLSRRKEPAAPASSDNKDPKDGPHKIIILLAPDPIRDAGYAAERRDARRRHATMPADVLNPEEARMATLVAALHAQFAALCAARTPGRPRDPARDAAIAGLGEELFAAKVYLSALRVLQFRTLGRLEVLELPGVAAVRSLYGTALREALEEAAEEGMPDLGEDEDEDEDEGKDYDEEDNDKDGGNDMSKDSEAEDTDPSRPGDVPPPAKRHQRSRADANTA